jgi:hypothetical protein
LIVPDKELSPSEDEGRVIGFRRGKVLARPDPSPVESLSKYEQDQDQDDYRHRMIVNAVVFVFVVGLIGAAVWLADTMATMQKNQDCVLSGRRGCTPIEVTKDRW